MNEMKEAVGNWREAKQFSPADENDFLVCLWMIHK